MVSRLETTPFAAWWWTVDRMLLAALLALMLGGIILSLAASPPVASRLGLEPFYFVNRHVLYLVPALAVLLGTSFLRPGYIRRLALVVVVTSSLLVAATLHFGAEVKGARRWIVLLGVNIQPSEFLKPSFVILIAWLFGESARRPNADELALLLVAVTRLVQPDFQPDHAGGAGAGALFLPRRHAAVLGRRARRRAAVIRWRLHAHSHVAPHRAVSAIHLRRRPASLGAQILPARRLVRTRPGEDVGASCGEPHRFRVRGSGGRFGIVLLLLVTFFMFIVLRALRHATRSGPLPTLHGRRPRHPVRTSKPSTWQWA